MALINFQGQKPRLIRDSSKAFAFKNSLNSGWNKDSFLLKFL